MSDVERELSEAKAKIQAYEILLTSESWGAAYGACCEDYPEIAEQLYKYSVILAKKKV